MHEQSIFIEALEREDPAERAAFLDRACAGDADLRHRIDRLLQRHLQGGSFLESPASDLLATADEPIRERPGTPIGPYKLLEPIGEGGFGVVFMAEQSEPIRRRVALKVLKPGMDTRQVVARFEAERQALALMDHPHIARVFDGGETPTGRPYFVMELVKGVPITDFCDQGRLTPRERLGLFVHVCQAVQHAHQKGIIHRDLKPSNVLVTLQDGTPLVKVIDFGIAKALGQQLTDKTLFTGFAQMIGTPLYMSPEQAALSNSDVDTRSDIYSLGVLLYELLTGTTPFDKQRFQEAGYDEMRRIIREEEPPRPSTRISTLGQAATTVSAQRKSEPRRLSQLCRGELDWIVMKALEKARDRRYETASAFAADVQRFLNDEPVLACPPSAGYRLHKFVRRHKTGVWFAVVMLALTAVLSGVGAALIYGEYRNKVEALGRAEREETNALLEAAAAKENLNLAYDVMDKVYLRLLEVRVPRDPAQKQSYLKLLEEGLRFYESFAERNRDRPAAKGKTAVAYNRAGHLHSTLGRRAQARDTYAAAVRLQEELAAASPQDATRQETLAGYLLNLRAELRWTRQYGEGEKVARHALGLQSDLVKRFPDNVRFRQGLSVAFDGLGDILRVAGRLPEAERAKAEALRIRQELAVQYPDDPRHQDFLATAHNNLAIVLAHTKGLAEAEKRRREALKIELRLVEKHPSGDGFQSSLALIYLNQAATLERLSRLGEAEELYCKGAALYKKLVDASPAVADYRWRWASCLWGAAHIHGNTGRHAEAEKEYEQARDLLLPLVQELPDNLECKQALAMCYRNFANLLLDTDRRTAAADNYRRALKFQRELVERYDEPEYREELAGTCNSLGELLRLLGRTDEARAALEEGLRLHQALVEWSHGLFFYRGCLAMSQYNLGVLLQNSGRPKEAEKLYREILNSYEQHAASLPPEGLDSSYRGVLAYSHLNLGALLGQARRFAEAEKAFAQARQLQQALVEEFPKSDKFRSALGHILYNLAVLSSRNPKEARRLVEQAIAQEQEARRLNPREPNYVRLLHTFYVGAIDSLLRLGEHGEAAKRAEELCDLPPQDWRTFYQAAGCLAQCARLAARDSRLSKEEREALVKSYEARTHVLMRQASKGDVDGAEAMGRLAWFLAAQPNPQKGDGERAVELARKAVRQQPKAGRYWSYLGAAQYRTGQWREAVKALDTAADLGAKNVYGTVIWAMAQCRLGKRDLARRALAQVGQWMESNPADVDDTLRRLRAEAAALLELEKPPAQNDKETSPPKK
jgi:serine/threonine protein kinase/Flp pilus assembly protein TadD